MKSILPLLASALLVLPAGGAFAKSGEFGSLAILLGIEAVRQDLKVTPAQAARLDALRTQYRGESRAIVQSTAQRPPAQAADDLAKVTARSNKAALSVLTSDQRKRLAKIEKDYLGAHLLHSASIQKELGLDKKQIDAISTIRKSFLATENRINTDYEAGKINNAARLSALRSARLDDESRLLKVLTPAQRKAFDSLP